MKQDQLTYSDDEYSAEQSLPKGELSDSELIHQCLINNDKKSWEIFFRRYNKFIDKRISKTLTAAGIAYDIDIIDEIRLPIIKKLYKTSVLEQVDDATKLKPWLGKLTRNHTLDWMRSRNKISNSFSTMVENESISLSQPMSWDRDLVMEDYISSEAYDQEDFSSDVNEALSKIESLGDRYRLTLKLAIMFYDPLCDETIREIAEKTGIPFGKVTEKVGKIMEELVSRHSKSSRDQGKAFILWAFIKRLKIRINHLEHDSSHYQEQIDSLKREIIEKSQRINKIRSRHKRIIRPSSRQIADLLRIPEDKVSAVNILLFRAREMLKKEKIL